MPVRLVSLLVATLLLFGCGGGGDGTVTWRDLTLALPDGWSVFEDEETRLSIANVPLGDLLEDGEPPTGDVVAMFFTYEPSPRPDAWRRYAADRGATIELDEATEIAGVPATHLQILDETGGAGATLTRELVVLVPARGVVMLAQPVPNLGEDDVTDVFDRAAPIFQQVLDSISWGAPLDVP